MIQMRTLKLSEDKSLALGHTTRKLQCRDVKACYFFTTLCFLMEKGQCHWLKWDVSIVVDFIYSYWSSTDYHTWELVCITWGWKKPEISTLELINFLQFPYYKRLQLINTFQRYISVVNLFEEIGDRYICTWFFRDSS